MCNCSSQITREPSATKLHSQGGGSSCLPIGFQSSASLRSPAQTSTTTVHQQPDNESGFSALLKQLSAGVRKEDVKRREGWRDRSGQAHYVDYVEWHTVADLLDRIVPDWSHAVRGIVQIGDFVAATAAITVN
jgi:hypothetical protein